jgi:leucyl aminopeptidase (aminopeptidase T)
MPSLQYAIRSVLKDCLKIHQKEIVLIIADQPMKDIGTSFLNEACHFSKNVHFLIIPEIDIAAREPCSGIAAIMAQSEVVIIITSKSLSNTQARRKACRNGVRIISLPGITKESLIRTLNGNYKEVVSLSRKIADILTIGKTALLTSKNGTNMAFSLSRVKGHADTGMVHEPGQFSNLPAGRGCTSPAPNSANGVIVIDGSFPEIGPIKNPVRMTVKEGHIQRITGGEEAETIKNMLRPFGKAGKAIAEIGIGTNANAQFTGFTVEDIKVKGSMHVVLGNNLSFDGKNDVPCYLNGVIQKPTLLIDGTKIIIDGILQV